ncbi:MAG: hypothetical protein QG597_3112 [Actinomycetota bacterium]|nr:hypothetical protein [Actinomycetota bacterium]
MNVSELFFITRSVRTSPVWTSRAAMIETVPCRTYSNSRRAIRPGRQGRQDPADLGRRDALGGQRLGQQPV